MKIKWLHSVLLGLSFCQVESVDKLINFCGDMWVLRLIHAIFDFDDNREAMLLQCNTLIRQELDA